MDFLVELERGIIIILSVKFMYSLLDFAKKIIWNFFASNHGGGAADGDGQTAQRHLTRFVKHNR